MSTIDGRSALPCKDVCQLRSKSTFRRESNLRVEVVRAGGVQARVASVQRVRNGRADVRQVCCKSSHCVTQNADNVQFPHSLATDLLPLSAHNRLYLHSRYAAKEGRQGEEEAEEG